MSYYYLKEESVLPLYLQFPEFLMNLPISQTAKITYMVLYDRARLSQKNKWRDEEWCIFIIFPIKEICKRIGKGETAVKQAMNDLDIAGLLKRKSGGFSKPNHIYIRIPHSSSFSASDGNIPSVSMGKQLSDGHKTVSTTVGSTTPNKVMETSNIKQSKRTSNFVTNNFGKTMKSAMLDYSCLEGEEHMQKIKELRRNCFQYSNYGDAIFQNSKVVNKQFVFCQKYVKDWEQMKEKNIGMLFWGDVGTGKTYLAACVANALIEREVSVRMLNFSHILNSGFETRNELLEDICCCSLLIIDDFGSKRETEYGLETIHSVLDARYNCGKPMIVTTNLPLQTINNPVDVMHKKIYDRLKNCVPVQFTGESFRKDIGNQKKEEFRQMLLEVRESF